MKHRPLSLLIGLSLFQLTLAPLLRAEQLTLSDALKRAKAHHSILKQAVQTVEAAQWQQRAVHAEKGFTLSTAYHWSRLDKPPYATMGGTNPVDQQVAHRHQTQWELTLSQPIFTGFALSSRHKISQIEVDIQKSKKEMARLDLFHLVKRTYFELLFSGKELEVAKDSVNSLAAHEKDAQKHVQAGLIKKHDLLRARVALAEARQHKEEVLADLDVARTRLNRWMGEPFSSTFSLQGPPLEIKIPKLTPLIQKALARRPRLKVLRLDLKSRDQDTRLAKSNYYPKVNAVASYSQTGNDLTAETNHYANTHNTTIGLDATWNLFQFGNTRAKVKKALHRKRALIQEIRNAEDAVRLEVKTSWLHLQVAEKNITTSEASLASAQENWRITRLGYAHQMATSAQVLDARADLTQAKTTHFKAINRYQTAMADLERAAGGPLF